MIPVQESKEEVYTLMLSRALAELVVDSEEVKQISGNDEWFKLKVIEIASDIGDSSKEVELGEKTEHEQNVTEAMLVLEQIQIEEKTSLDKKKVGLIVEITGEIRVSEDVKWTELKQDVGEERDVSMHEIEIFVAKNTSIKGVELEKDVTKAVLVVTEEKGVLVHETKISVDSIPVQERKE